MKTDFTMSNEIKVRSIWAMEREIFTSHLQTMVTSHLNFVFIIVLVVVVIAIHYQYH
jgi:hypothetical protein